MRNGERGTWQGHVFALYARDLLIKLGYKEIFSGKYDIDFLGEPIQNSSSLVAPRLAPSGITAFEFTSQSSVSDQTIRKLAMKIKKIKNRYDVKGGTILCDIRISDNLYSEASKMNIYVWDLRDCGFYTEKYRIFKILEEKGQTQEIIVADKVTYIWTLDRITESGFFKGYLCILFHQQAEEVTKEYIVGQFTKIHHQIADRLKSIGCIPIEIEVIWFLRPYVSKDVHLSIDSVLKEFSEEESVTYTLNGLYNFYIAPWFFGLHSQL